MPKPNGGFATDATSLEPIFGAGLEAAAAIEVLGVSEASPVLSGALALSWIDPEAASAAAWTTPTTLTITITSAVVYAKRQEYDTRNAGYAERGIGATQAEAVTAAGAALAGRLAALWSNT